MKIYIVYNQPWNYDDLLDPEFIFASTSEEDAQIWLDKALKIQDKVNKDYEESCNKYGETGVFKISERKALIKHLNLRMGVVELVERRKEITC